MPEGDTIHRVAGRMNAALGGRPLERVEAPSPRSPLHGRVAELAGRTLERAEARGKHLLVHLSGELVIHSHLGMNGRWRIAADGRRVGPRPWLLLGSGSASAAQSGGRLRLVSEARARSDPTLLALGPDPLGAGFDPELAAARLLELGAGREVGEALLDQRIVAGVGNVIRNQACFETATSPWRGVGDLSPADARRLIDSTERIMRIGLDRGRRPNSIYRARRCPRCGGPVSSRGQGDDNRIAYWCPRCQA